MKEKLWYIFKLIVTFPVWGIFYYLCEEDKSNKIPAKAKFALISNIIILWVAYACMFYGMFTLGSV